MKHVQGTKGLIFVFILMVLTINSAISQERIKIRKDIKVDTLSLSVNYPKDFDFEKQVHYGQLLKNVAERANMKFSFYTEPGGFNSQYGIGIDMGSVIYTTKKDNLNSSLLNTLFIGGHAAMIGIFGWTLPILIYSSPDTTSEIIIYVDENLTDQSTEIESKFQSNGYFASVERQDKRFERRFEKSLFKMVKHINKQNVRNNKNR